MSEQDVAIELLEERNRALADNARLGALVEALQAENAFLKMKYEGADANV